MTALENPRRERLARLLASNVPVREAFEQAGFKLDAGGGNAYRLARTPAIVERVSQLQAEAMNAQGLSAELIVAAASAVALGEIDTSAVDPDNLTPEQRRAASSIEVTKDAQGRRVTRVRFDKMPALTLLGKWRGMEREERADLREFVPVASPLDQIIAKMDEIRARNGWGNDAKLIEHIPVSN